MAKTKRKNSQLYGVEISEPTVCYIMYVCVCVCVYIYIYIYIHTHTHTYTHTHTTKLYETSGIKSFNRIEIKTGRSFL